MTLIKPDCANTVTRWLGPDGKPAVTRDRHIKAYGIPNDLITIAAGEEYCINCDISQTIAPENLSPGETYDVDHLYTDLLQDRWVESDECGGESGEPCYTEKWIGYMKTEEQEVTVTEIPAPASLEAAGAFDPDVWLVKWADIAGSQTIAATLSGIGFSGLDESSIRLNGSVEPTSVEVQGGMLRLRFERQAAVASFQNPPLPGRFPQTIQGRVAGGLFTGRGEVRFVDAISVVIDIKPDDSPNSINLKSKGSIPVAVLSSSEFDAQTLDPATVTLAGAPVRTTGKKGKFQAAFEDVDGDGLTDLLMHFDTAALQLSVNDTEAVLEGRTYAGEPVVGKDTVRIVK